MATPQAKLKVPKVTTSRPGFLPVRVPPQMRDDFFLTFEIGMTDEAFDKFVQANSELRIERTAEGVIEVMPPAKTKTGARNGKITARLIVWAEDEGSGVAFDSSTGFKLPNGAIRSPNASWVRRTRLAGLSSAEIEGYWPLCPDFVLELRSSSDRISKLKEKMEEYIANGAQLGWLIDAKTRKVYVYRHAAEMEVLEEPARLTGELVLPGFVLDLRPIWEPDF